MADEQTPIGGSQFITGAAPGGFGARMFKQADNTIRFTMTLGGEKEGPPGHGHGGSLATLLDEAMGAACWVSGYWVLAANLNINYKRPVPLNTEVVITGKVERQEGRKIYTSGEITLPDGTVATTGSGIFIESPEHFNDAFNEAMRKRAEG